MARADLAAVAQRLYERFLAPLVLGGDLTPGPAVGPRSALSLDGGLVSVDRDLRSRVDLARVRVARRLVPVDVLEGPDASEWSFAAALHDMVFALHPGLDHLLHRSARDRLLAFAEETTSRIPRAASLADELSRHTFFARVLELHRTDTAVSWWTGSRTFLGTAPPPRLLAWPEVRNVHTSTTVVSLGELPDPLGGARRERFLRVLAEWMGKLPLTDLATASRTVAPFQWTADALGLFAQPQGKVLGLRALALGPAPLVDAALGRATAVHVKAGAWENVSRIGDVLAERALAAASSEAEGATAHDVSDEAAYARALGAALAIQRLDALGISRGAARQVASRLVPVTRGVRGEELADVVQRLGPVRPP